MKLTAESTVINDQKINTDISTAQTTATDAQTTANTAKSIAENTDQFFWFTSSGTDTGAHITEKTQAQFLASPSGGNLLARSNGIAVRDGMTEMATFTSNGVAINQGGAEVASFGASSRIGKQSSNNIVTDANGIGFYNGISEIGGVKTINNDTLVHGVPIHDLSESWADDDDYGAQMRFVSVNSGNSYRVDIMAGNRTEGEVRLVSRYRNNLYWEAPYTYFSLSTSGLTYYMGGDVPYEVFKVDPNGKVYIRGNEVRFDYTATTRGTDGIWTYEKRGNTYHAWYEGTINLGTTSSWGGGYMHQSSTAHTPPSFSTGVTSLTGACNGAGSARCAYTGHTSDYYTYWFNNTGGTTNNVPVRLDMYGTCTISPID